ncbi:hypothetical protein [Streptomyces sp. NPDC050804]|uniref:hypothetical protein n=1 Tax=Streptomyces sp. NPDC050804 TaxID=3154745 RepID=UPI003444E07E
MERDKSPTVYGNHQAPAEYEPGEGCLTTAVRIPVRIVVLLIVLPVRIGWDVLVIGARALHRVTLRPLGRALGWLGRVLLVIPSVWLYGAVLTPLGHALVWLGRYGLVVPVVWVFRSVFAPVGRGVAWLAGATGSLLVRLYETLLTPLGHGLAWLAKAVLVRPCAALWRFVLVPLVRYGVVVPVVWTCRNVLAPLGRGGVWLLRVVLVVPVSWFCRRVLVPLGRETVAAFGVAWRVAGHVSRALGRVLAWLAWNVLGRPARWAYITVCTPLGHWLRDNLWAPAARTAAAVGRVARDTLRTARATIRQARRDVWRTLVGAPRPRKAGELPEGLTRTLGSTTIVPGAEPAPEISLRKRG